MMLTKMPKVGDKVKYIGEHRSFLTYGEEYRVLSVDVEEEFGIKDDEGDVISYDHSDFERFELVTEPTPPTSDLIANLARRVGELETQTKPKDYAKVGPNTTPADAVNPSHYKQGGVEVIDIIRQATDGADGFEGLCLGNVIKYTMRYRHKNGVEDLRKARVYLDWLIGELEAKA